jgi:hypothetical protein
VGFLNLERARENIERRAASQGACRARRYGKPFAN